MATRISDETAARIEAAYPDLLDHLAAGDVMAPHYARHRVTADQVRVWRVRSQERMAEWDQAREQSADAYAEQILEVANNPGADSGVARVRVDALRWLATRRNPRVYGDKAELNLNVRTIDLTRVISDAQARLAAAQAGRILEGEVLRPRLPEDLT